MPEPLIYKRDKRVIFPPGEQHQFLLKAINNLKLSWLPFADKIGVNKRTLNDWKREKYSLPLNVLKRVSIVAKLKIPRNIKIRDPFWYVHTSGRAGGLAVYKKYGRIGGNPEYRKKKWYEWWEQKGKFINRKGFFKRKAIKKPRKSTRLAEFVGIVIGDGGITKRQITITLHSKDDKEYSKFVVALIKRLFDVPVGTYYRRNVSATSFIISRIELVRFCIEKLRLKIGNKVKQQIDIPKWIKRNKSFKISCTRGLIDTDGCIFNECHKINKKKYCYPRLSFVSHSKPLRISVYRILEELGFSPKIRNDKSVQLERRNEIVKYFDLIGTNNPKHKKRFKSFLGEVG